MRIFPHDQTSLVFDSELIKISTKFQSSATNRFEGVRCKCIFALEKFRKIVSFCYYTDRRVDTAIFVLISIWIPSYRELRYNNIMRLPLNAFDGLPSLGQLHIVRNNIHCDCSMLSLVKRLVSRNIQTQVVCATPDVLRGRSIEDVNASELECSGKYESNSIIYQN